MATPKGIATMLAVLHEAFPHKEITDATGPLWLGWFRDEDDAALLDAANRCSLDRTRQFFPSPGEFRDILHPAPPLDSGAVLRRIESLGSYNAHVGWIWPSVEAVRRALGDGIARAYSAIGSARLRQDEGTGRDIAVREFTQELQAVVAKEGPKALAAMTDTNRLTGGSE